MRATRSFTCATVVRARSTPCNILLALSYYTALPAALCYLLRSGDNRLGTMKARGKKNLDGDAARLWLPVRARKTAERKLSINCKRERYTSVALAPVISSSLFCLFRAFSMRLTGRSPGISGGRCDLSMVADDACMSDAMVVRSATGWYMCGAIVSAQRPARLRRLAGRYLLSTFRATAACASDGGFACVRQTERTWDASVPYLVLCCCKRAACCISAACASPSLRRAIVGRRACGGDERGTLASSGLCLYRYLAMRMMAEDRRCYLPGAFRLYHTLPA